MVHIHSVFLQIVLTDFVIGIVTIGHGFPLVDDTDAVPPSRNRASFQASVFMRAVERPYADEVHEELTADAGILLLFDAH
jgi:hypothetical protein